MVQPWAVLAAVVTSTLAASHAGATPEGSITRVASAQSAPTAPVAPVTRVDAILSSSDVLLSLVRQAHRGERTPQELRHARLELEASLRRTLASMPAVTRPEDVLLAERAVGRLNQVIIRSQEWEFFGAQPRPQWGWDPQREIRAIEHGIPFGDVIVASSR